MVWSSLSSKTNGRRQSVDSELRDTMPSRNVCRNLFGPVNHREIQEEIEKDKRQLMAAKKNEYNFDFEKEEPFPGRYLWEKPSLRFANSSICTKLSEPLTTEEPLVTKSKTTCTNFMKNDSCDPLLKRDLKEHEITGRFTLEHVF